MSVRIDVLPSGAVDDLVLGLLAGRAHHHERRAVAHVDVIPVRRELFGRELPVALEHPLVDATDDLGSLVVVVQHGVHVPGHVAERVTQRDRLRVPGPEDQALVRLDVRHLDQTPVGDREGVGVAILVGDTDELALEVVGPAVIGAGEVPGLPEVRAADPGPTVPARVEVGAQVAVLVQGDNDRVLTHVGGEEVAGLVELVHVGQEEPARGEDPAQLLLVELLVGEDRSVDEATLRVHQPGDVDRRSQRGRALEPPARSARGAGPGEVRGRRGRGVGFAGRRHAATLGGCSGVTQRDVPSGGTRAGPPGPQCRESVRARRCRHLTGPDRSALGA